MRPAGPSTSIKASRETARRGKNGSLPRLTVLDGDQPRRCRRERKLGLLVTRAVRSRSSLPAIGY